MYVYSYFRSTAPMSAGLRVSPVGSMESLFKILWWRWRPNPFTRGASHARTWGVIVWCQSGEAILPSVHMSINEEEKTSRVSFILLITVDSVAKALLWSFLESLRHIRRKSKTRPYENKFWYSLCFRASLFIIREMKQSLGHHNKCK